MTFVNQNHLVVDHLSITVRMNFMVNGAADQQLVLRLVRDEQVLLGCLLVLLSILILSISLWFHVFLVFKFQVVPQKVLQDQILVVAQVHGPVKKLVQGRVHPVTWFLRWLHNAVALEGWLQQLLQHVEHGRQGRRGLVLVVVLRAARVGVWYVICCIQQQHTGQLRRQHLRSIVQFLLDTLDHHVGGQQLEFLDLVLAVRRDHLVVIDKGRWGLRRGHRRSQGGNNWGGMRLCGGDWVCHSLVAVLVVRLAWLIQLHAALGTTQLHCIPLSRCLGLLSKSDIDRDHCGCLRGSAVFVLGSDGGSG